MTKTKEPKIFYGWIIIIAGFLTTFAGMGVINSMSGVLLVPITEDLGFTRAEFTFHRSILFLLGACFMPLYGRLFEKFGVKKIMIITSIAIAFCIYAFSWATTLSHFYWLAVLNSIFITGISFLSVGYLIASWFEDRRGFVTGIAFAGFGIGTMIFIPISTWIYEQTDWQTVYQVIGVIVLIIVFPTTMFLVKDKPEDIGQKPYRNKEETKTIKSVEAKNISFKQALKSPVFWMLISAFFLLSIIQGGPNFNAIPFLTDIGHTEAFAALVMSGLMLAHTIGNLSLGTFFDKFGMKNGGLFLGICCIIFPLLALGAGNQIFVWLFAIFYGPASSGFVPVAVVVTYYFGGKNFALIFAVFNMAMQLGMSISGPAMAIVYDLSGSYNISWLMLTVFGVIITAFLFISFLVNKKPSKVR